MSGYEIIMIIILKILTFFSTSKRCAQLTGIKRDFGNENPTKCEVKLDLDKLGLLVMQFYRDVSGVFEYPGKEKQDVSSSTFLNTEVSEVSPPRIP